MANVHETLGRNVRLLRECRGWTQARLAETTGISPTFMMHIERGTRGVSLDTVEQLANALSVEIGVLFESSADSRQHTGGQDTYSTEMDSAGIP